WRLIGFGMGVLAATAAALAAPRRALQTALMIATIVAAALALGQRLNNPGAASGAPLFALTAILSLYGMIDALTVRQSAERRTPRAERLFLPAPALLASLIVMIQPGAVRVLAPLAAALALLTGALLVRERRGGSGVILLGAATAVFALAS